MRDDYLKCPRCGDGRMIPGLSSAPMCDLACEKDDIVPGKVMGCDIVKVTIGGKEYRSRPGAILKVGGRYDTSLRRGVDLGSERPRKYTITYQAVNAEVAELHKNLIEWFGELTGAAADESALEDDSCEDCGRTLGECECDDYDEDNCCDDCGLPYCECDDIDPDAMGPL